jgi:hypothetical protein
MINPVSIYGWRRRTLIFSGTSEGALKGWEGRRITYGESGKEIRLPHPSHPTYATEHGKALAVAKKLEAKDPEAAAEIYDQLGLPNRARKLNQLATSRRWKGLSGESQAARDKKKE